MHASTAPRPALVGTEGLYLTGDDHLLVTAHNSAASVRIRVSGRQLDLEGQIKTFEQEFVPPTDRTSGTMLLRLCAGWLQNVTAIALVGAPAIGQTFVRVDLVRGDATPRTTHATLLQGYLTAAQRRAWPGSALESSLQGPGVIRSITGTDPAAGAEISETVPTGARWRVVSMLTTLVTSVAAANREAAFVTDDGATPDVRVPSGVNHPASTTVRYAWFHGAQQLATVTDITRQSPIPLSVLEAGQRIRTLTTNLQAGDEWAAPQLRVEEWLAGVA